MNCLSGRILELFLLRLPLLGFAFVLGSQRSASPQRFDFQSSQMKRVKIVIQKRFGGDGDDRTDKLKDRDGIVADFLLGVLVHSQRQEMEKIVQIDLPVELRVNTDRERNAGEFAGDAFVDEMLILRVLF